MFICVDGYVCVCVRLHARSSQYMYSNWRSNVSCQLVSWSVYELLRTSVSTSTADGKHVDNCTRIRGTSARHQNPSRNVVDALILIRRHTVAKFNEMLNVKFTTVTHSQQQHDFEIIIVFGKSIALSVTHQLTHSLRTSCPVPAERTNSDCLFWGWRAMCVRQKFKC